MSAASLTEPELLEDVLGRRNAMQIRPCIGSSEGPGQRPSLSSRPTTRSADAEEGSSGSGLCAGHGTAKRAVRLRQWVKEADAARNDLSRAEFEGRYGHGSESIEALWRRMPNRQCEYGL